MGSWAGTGNVNTFTDTVFTQSVTIDGSENEVQLNVQASSSQLPNTPIVTISDYDGSNPISFFKNGNMTTTGYLVPQDGLIIGNAVQWYVEPTATGLKLWDGSLAYGALELGDITATGDVIVGSDTTISREALGGLRISGATASYLQIWGSAGIPTLYGKSSGTAGFYTPNNFMIGDTSQLNFVSSTSGTPDVGLARDSAGVLRVSDGSTGVGGILHKAAVEVEASTPHSVTAAESGTVFTNEGAAGDITFNLPALGAAAQVGLRYTFIQQDGTQNVVVVPDSGSSDTIRIAGSTTSTSATSTAAGDTLTIVAINQTEWVAIAVNGTWTLA